MVPFKIKLLAFKEQILGVLATTSFINMSVWADGHNYSMIKGNVIALSVLVGLTSLVSFVIKCFKLQDEQATWYQLAHSECKKCLNKNNEIKHLGDQVADYKKALIELKV